MKAKAAKPAEKPPQLATVLEFPKRFPPPPLPPQSAGELLLVRGAKAPFGARLKIALLVIIEAFGLMAGEAAANEIRKWPEEPREK